MHIYQPVRPSRSAFVPVRLHRYHVRFWGEKIPKTTPLILLHGWMDVAASWQFMIDALGTEFLLDRFIIAPDWRGFGHTEGPACDHYVFVDYLGDLDSLLNFYAPNQPVDLVGHSMGGHIAMMYAGVRNERVRHLINLEGVGMPGMDAAQAPNHLKRWLNEINSSHRDKRALQSYMNAEEVAARLMKTNPRLSTDKAHWLALQWAAPRNDEQGCTRWHILGDAAHRIVNAHLVREEEVLAHYRSITASVLIIEASEHEISYWYKGNSTLERFHDRLKSIKRTECITLPNCGHMVHHDQPDLLARQVERFLNTP